MKYLSDYIQEAQSKLFDDSGAFFAFSTDQFNEAKKDGVKYVHLGAGLIAPKENAKSLAVGLKEIAKRGIAQDIAENGKEAIIERELANHEAYYTGDTFTTIDALEDYGFTTDEINEVFKKTRDQHE